ncbi:MAG: hypothetical protein ACKUBY_01415 [Candidatus Moraniibacteriota bacterium]|jgi:DMSO/TMAO reductase YedYZ heme-binding membrane subunit
MKILRIIQNIIIGISLFVLSILPLLVAFGDDYIKLESTLYKVSFISVFLVMLIRPLADIFRSQKWLRKLVYLRKGFGILSASIIVGFVIGHIISPESQYIASMFTKEYWSLDSYMLFAHIGDITALILLITSNNLSMMLLKQNWKRIQKLAYVYFYTGGIYEALALESEFAIVAMIIITLVTIIAFVINIKKYEKN